MRSIKFPNMFNSNTTNTWKDAEYKEATAQNIKLLLKSERDELFGDPYFGVMLKHYYYEPNSYIMRDMLIDTIYTQLALFIPQLRIERKNISVIKDKKKGKVFCSFYGVNQIDYKVNSYNLCIFTESIAE